MHDTYRVTISLPIGVTISDAERESIAQRITDAIGEPVRVSYSVGVAESYFEPILHA